MMQSTELAIIGGGPAGLSAAAEAARAGVSSIVLDENPLLGGQIFRQPPAEFRVVNQKRMGKQYADGKKLIEELTEFKEKIDTWTGSLVWGYFNDKELAAMRKGRLELLKADQIVIATGAYDRPIPFPGWTLPGVFTAGCAQAMAKSQAVLTGTRFLLAGSGPLQLAVAHQLLKGGAKLVAVVEAASMIGLWRRLPTLLKQPGLLWDGFRYLATLKLHRVPFMQSHIIVGASGSEEVEEAVIAAADENWQPIPDTEQTFDVDAICLGYGLVPNTDLTRLCGCAHDYDPNLGGWVPKRDEHMETTIRGIFVAGDACGIGGVRVALEQGKLAGIYAACNLGHLDEATADKLARPIRRKLNKLQSFQSVIADLFSVRSGIHSLPEKDTLICRCEEICLDDIRKAIASGALHPDDIKRRTRAGMGYCQGRICGPTILRIAERQLSLRPSDIGPGRARSPVKPVPMSILFE
jgi:thioredoxin reductase/bacterioferritin-associated ferredoxin